MESFPSTTAPAATKPEAQTPAGKPISWRFVGGLLAVSFLLRLALCLPVIWWQVAPVFDEAAYSGRAEGFERLLAAGLTGRPLEIRDKRQAYGAGKWPPLHSLVLGAAALVSPWPAETAGRLAMVLLSALTTPLLYLLARRLVPETAARLAAVFHLLHPSFLAYSHYLWSETTYILLLVLLVLLCLEAQRRLSQNRLGPLAAAGTAAGAGVLLGLACLTRAAALPFVAVVPLWLWWTRGPRRGAVAAGLAVVACGLVTLPWLRTLERHEGRAVPLSTMASYNLALGNSPGVPDRFGSAWGHTGGKVALEKGVDLVMERHSLEREPALAVLALEELHEHPERLPRRMVERLRLLWAPDFFPWRHLLHADYPPLPRSWATFPLALGAVLTLAIHLGVLGLVFVGLGGVGSQELWQSLPLWLVVAGSLVAAATFGMCRLHLPLLALLLPYAGLGLLRLRQGWRVVSPAAVVATALLAVGAVTSLPLVVPTFLLPSSHYAPTVARLDALLGTRTAFTDCIRLARRESVEDLEITLLSPGARFASGRRQRPWRRLPPGQSFEQRIALEIVIEPGSPPLEIAVRGGESGRELRWRPVQREAWQRWQEVESSGLRYRWEGGGRPALRSLSRHRR